MEVINGGRRGPKRGSLGAKIHEENGKYIATGIDYNLSRAGDTEIEAMQNLATALEYIAKEFQATPGAEEALKRLKEGLRELEGIKE